MKATHLLALILLLGCSETAADTPTPTIETLTTKAVTLEPDLVELRRTIHRNPELPGQEVQTAALIADRLRDLGLEVRTGIGGHGLIGVLRGEKPGPILAYRSELDAVPGNEPPGRPYGSTVPGAFHACGHDLHMAIAVGVASVLASVREHLPGTVVFLFQPAEETWQGADAMLADGALDDPSPEAIYAVHSFPFRVGTMARDAAFAGLDRFSVTLVGTAATEESASRIEERLATLGNVKPPRSPDQVFEYLDQMQVADGPLSQALYVDIERDAEEEPWRIEGVLKAYSDAAYAGLRDEVRGILEAEAGSDGFELSYPDEPLPSMISDAAVTAAAAPALAEVIGPNNIISLQAQHAFSGEDFARFLQRVPGTMLLLGVGNEERGILGAPHFPDFDADEAAIQVGTQAMSVVLWRRLAQ
ncbi:MAG TPA: M20 family metallopeptidase [Polyangiaceae bacterium]|nr:M20 family metallopeptidase [Polyangiaceae bacterium]